jgi:hypothetical protein
MSGLEQPNASYIIISAQNIDSLMSLLYAKEYNVLPIKGYYDGQFEDSIMAYKQCDNDDLRRDTIFMLDQYNQESAIIKYLGETDARKIFWTGEERPLGVILYNTDSANKSYLHNGISFSFVEKARYRVPKKEEIKVGMVVEYMANNKWHEKKVRDVDTEWEKMFKLLAKYEKIRIAY